MFIKSKIKLDFRQKNVENCFMRNWIFNKYILTLLAFLIWMLFFDSNNFIYQRENMAQLEKMKNEKRYYLDEIKENEKELQELLTNQETLEKFARENYLMKKDGEEIFVILEEGKPIEKSMWDKIKDRFIKLTN